MAEEIFSQSWLESGNRQIFSPQEEELFSTLDLSLSIGYNSATNPFKDQSHPLFSSQDNNIVNRISTSSAAGNKTETISKLSQDVLNGTRNQVEPIRDEISRVNSIGDPTMHDENNKMKEIKSQKKRCRKDGDPYTLSKETISQYFDMRIDDAVVELNVGLTRFKKRCRQLGIARWPYQLKFRTLQKLETKIKELWEMDGEMNKSELKNIWKTLQMEKTRIENDPNLELGDNIDKLKNRLKELLSSTVSTSATACLGGERETTLS